MAEVDLRGSTPAHIPAALVQRLKTLASDLISLEQYMDFLMNRSFRQTLLCRRQVHLNRTLTSSENVLRPFYLSTGTVPVEGVNALQKEGALRMTAPDGQELVTAHPLSIAAFQVLAPESPAALAWTELIARATAIVEGDGGTVTQEDRDTLTGNVLRAFTAVRSFIGLSTLPDRYVPEISERPMAVALVRLLASEGCRRVPNRRHERVMLGPLAMALVTHLDGTQSLDDLRAIDERARLDRGPGGGEDDADEATFEARLAFLARSALLEA
jgi:methyltransferase-like protein